MKQSKFMIAAAGSGSGKTVVSCALMAAFCERGLKVAAAKCGPDYIDPLFHREVLGVDSENIDLYFCEETTQKKLFEEHTKDANATIVEGVMGYYDGMSLHSDRASSYHVAHTLGLPVILTVPCKGMALSVVPGILGMLEFRKDSNIKGILLNQVSEALYSKLKPMIEEELKQRGYALPVLGYIPQDDAFCLKGRHLGLIMPQELTHIKEQLLRAGEILEQTVDLDRLLAIGQETTLAGLRSKVEERNSGKVRIGVARDQAFCFYYKDNLELLEHLGCQLVPFSPLTDSALPEDIQGLILGGGYPELYAGGLAENRAMLKSIGRVISEKMPCLAECGGFMYLHDELEGEDGHFYPMAGVVAGRAYRTSRLVRFGYIEIITDAKNGFLKKGETLRGHEFHYWESTNVGGDCFAVKPDKRRSWNCIHMNQQLFAGYPHIHFYSNLDFARRFVSCCSQYGKET